MTRRPRLSEICARLVPSGGGDCPRSYLSALAMATLMCNVTLGIALDDVCSDILERILTVMEKIYENMSDLAI